MCSLQMAVWNLYVNYASLLIIKRFVNDAIISHFVSLGDINTELFVQMTMSDIDAFPCVMKCLACSV